MITTPTQTFVIFCSWSVLAGTLNTGINVCMFAPAHPPSASMRGVGQRLLSSSMTASRAPWLSNADLISGPGMQAGLNGRLLTQTQMGFGFIKANILSVVRRHFSCTDVGLPVRSNGPLYGYQGTICQAFSSVSSSSRYELMAREICREASRFQPH